MYKYRGKRQRGTELGRQVSCEGKIRWWTKERAQIHAKEINETRLIGDREVRAYKCRFSEGPEPHFHVGRRPKPN